jgi:hypothetical protein
MTNGDGGIPLGSTYKGRTVPTYSQQQGNSYDLSRLLSSEPAPTGLAIPHFLSVIAAVEDVRRENKGLCDLDPRRIVFTGDGTVELSILPPPSSGMTVVLTSSKYLAPEMVEDVTGQNDSCLLESYVLGFVFYEIFLGRDLFEQQFQDVSGHGKFGWLAWHADRLKRAKPLKEIISGFPSVLSQVIEGMMAKEAVERITDLHRIAATIAGSSQATMMISNLSALQGGDEVRASPWISVPQRVDMFWRRFVGTAHSALRKLSWHRIFARKHEQPFSAHNARQFFRRRETEQSSSPRAYQPPNTRKGSGVE